MTLRKRGDREVTRRFAGYPAGRRGFAGGRAARRVRRAVGWAVLAAVAAGPAGAEEPLWGEIASTLGKGFVNVTSRGSYSETQPFRHHGGAVLLTTSRMDAVVGVEYGLRPNLDLGLHVPFLSEEIDESFEGQTARHPISGMGEMQMGTKWRFWQSIGDSSKNELALIAGLKLPTGDSQMKDPHGAIIPAHLQPNSGNLGGSVALAADRHFAMGGFWLSAMFTTEASSQRYRRGDMLELHASTGRRLRPLTRAGQTDWMGIVGFHYHRMGEESELGRTLPDSGGSDLDAELGLVASKGTFGLRLGVLQPISTHYGLAHPPPGREIQASVRGSF
jgi:hypothetical protein